MSVINQNNMPFKKIHGMSTSGGTKKVEKFYSIWSGMKQRCLNPNVINYHIYGGRGIKVCERWMTFLNFKDDMLESFLHHMSLNGGRNTTLGRIKNDEGYSKGNCRWETMKEQSNNSRMNHFVEYNGEKKTISQWAEKLGIDHVGFALRLKRGWSIKKAIETPKRNYPF
jgi:hypothetical protein